MGAPDVPFELLRWRIILDTGWTLDYVRSLSVADFFEYLQVKDGMNKALK